ncbi:putative PDUPA2 [Pluteus cervinus]|uniref:PDUPA2 n=1 Tax=Pluteus cervinus TaxID=181527 RepID=A0ACD3BHI0_9AGAR|nr:putative PDUPA2 [Pluteus cervinus]
MAMLSSPVMLIQAIPPVTRYFTAATVVGSSVYAWLQWKGIDLHPAYLLLVPGSSIFYPWTFVTSALVEVSIFELLTTLLLVPASLRYLERLWGSIETLKFIVVCVGVSNIIAFAMNWIEFIATSNADLFLYGMEYRGQMALQIAVLVAFTQLIPEHQVQVLGVFKARVKSMPMAMLTLSTVLCLLGFQCPWIIIQFGWFVSWIYLRFYKKNSGDSVGGTDSYGDRSETFSLISWFPPFMHGPLSILGNFVYHYANRFHLIPATVDIENAGYVPVPGGARAEAERRRALALKALDQRLAAGSGASSPVPGPSQSPRPPVLAKSAESSTSSSSSSPATVSRGHDRQNSKNVSEVDLGDTGKPKTESR